MQSPPKISICIPAYDMAGDGANFLAHSFDGLETQSFTDFEIVVSDQSGDDAIKALCARRADTLRIRHVWNRNAPRQASANCNNAVHNAGGEIIKILFQDDFVFGSDALQKTWDGFHDPSSVWLLCGSGVTRDGLTMERPMVPRMHPQIQFGKNTVSSPSVLSFRAGHALEFDENLIWLMDVDIYNRFALCHGPPAIVQETLVLNRLHDGQISASISPELRRRELRYMWNKQRGNRSWRNWLAFARQMLKAR